MALALLWLVATSTIAASASPIAARAANETCTPALASDPYNIFLSSNHSVGWKFTSGGGEKTVALVANNQASGEALEWQIVDAGAGFNILPNGGDDATVCIETKTRGSKDILASGSCCSAAAVYNITCQECGQLFGDPFATGCTITASDGLCAMAAKPGDSIRLKHCSAKAVKQKFDFELA
ncbi:hypothetical protein RQP46_008020 [Phenoliferia psychrophenolica]